MSKKHFIALTNVLRALKPEFGKINRQTQLLGTVALIKQYECHVYALADWCASQNRAFNRERWLDYINGECGPNGGKVK